MRLVGISILCLVAIALVAANADEPVSTPQSADVRFPPGSQWKKYRPVSLYQPAAADQRPDTVLNQWERSASHREAVDLDQYRDRYGSEYSESELQLATALLGPVEATSLQNSFRWSVTGATDSEIRLRAAAKTQELPATMAALGRSSADLQNAGGLLQTGAASRGDLAAEAAVIEIVLDRRFFEPRLIRWPGSSAGESREGIERLAPDDLPLVEAEIEQRRSLARGNGGVIQASAMMLEGDPGNAGESDPRLLELLSRWEQAAADCKALELRFKRYDYDNIFELETRGEGRFVYVAPNKGLYDLKPATVVERADGRTKARGGNFAVTPAKPQTFWWNGETVKIADGREKSYDELAVPKGLRADVCAIGSWDVIWQVLAGPQKALPGVVDLRAEGFLNRFRWTIIKDDETEIMIEGRPVLAADRRHMSRLDVILDPTQFRTMATRVIDPAGSRETVHTFEYVLVNDAQLHNEEFWKPDLSAFSPVGPPPMAPPAEVLPAVPPTQQ